MAITTGSRTVTHYVGVADWWGAHVWVERGGARRALRYQGDEPLAGFAWGRRGAAARELSRSLLHDATGSPAIAERYCRQLTHALVATLPAEGFDLDRDDILAWVEEEAAAEARYLEAHPAG
jgi:hypothetical protein